MQLTRFRIRKFRNIVDSGDIVVDPQVTCLVGMNEAGKTAILAALHRLQPVGRATFDVQRDYPRWLANKDRKAGIIDDARPIEADFELDANDKAKVGRKFGENVLTSATVTVHRKYNAPWRRERLPRNRAPGWGRRSPPPPLVPTAGIRWSDSRRP